MKLQCLFCVQCVYSASCGLFVVFLWFFLLFNVFYCILRRWTFIRTASRRLSCRLLCFCVSFFICTFWDVLMFFFSIPLLFIVVSNVCNVLDVAVVRESCLLLFTLSSPWEHCFQCFECMLPHWFWLCWVYSCICVVDFSCFACFFLLYYVLVLILWRLFDCILRSGGVFTRLYEARVCFCVYMCVFRVPLLFSCLSLVPFVLYSIIMHFASMDFYSHSV